MNADEQTAPWINQSYSKTNLPGLRRVNPITAPYLQVWGEEEGKKGRRAEDANLSSTSDGLSINEGGPSPL